MRKRILLVGGATVALLSAAYGALTYYRYGRESPGRTRHPLLDPFIPGFDVQECHAVEVAAPADLTWASARAVGLRRSRLIRGIFQARQLLMAGRRRSQPETGRPFLEEALALGWRVLTELSGQGIVLGAVTQPWLADVTFRSFPGEEFATFNEPGWVKIAWTIEVVPLGADRSLVSTETRAVATDAESRARFRRYWSIVRPGVVLIRREMLRLVKREAETRARVSGASRTTGPRLEPDRPVPFAR